MELSVAVLLVGTVATFVFGLSKTAVPAVGSFGAALLTTVLPPLASTGVALPVLLVGDAIALSLYARHVEARLLLRMLPTVAAGLAAGFAVVRWVDTSVAVRLIGATLLVAGLGEILRRRRSARTTAPAEVTATLDLAPRPARDGAAGAAVPDAVGAPGPARRDGDRSPVALLLGTGAGFSTMVANAGGPMMTLYLLHLRLPTAAFLGTTAWFFAVVNLLKVPLSVGLGLITPSSLVVSAALTPGIVLGGLLGRRLVLGMSRRAFETAALVATSAAGAWLLLG